MKLTPILAAPLALLPIFASFAPAVAQGSNGAEAQIITPESTLAVEAPELHALFSTIGLYDILGVMSVEGIQAAGDMEQDMFPGQGGSAWPAVVAGIYATDRLVSDFEGGVPQDLMTDTVVAELTEFFSSDLGQRIAEGELVARQAFIEPGVEEAAIELAATRAADGDARIGLLTRFMAANDLVERNVAGALNANFAFYRGLTDGGAFATEIPEDLMLAEVWGQEPEIRSDTTEWLYGYQLMAYDDLTDADIAAYTAFSETEAGRVFNRVLFVAFDVMFERVSYDLGAAAAGFIAGEET